MNFKLLRLFAFAFILLSVRSLSAQCEYTLQMEDSFGDGWNGAVLTISSGADVNTYNLLSVFQGGNGSDSTVTFNVNAGVPLVFSWSPGFFDTEVAFTILDNNGDVVYVSGTLTAGVLFTGVGVCPSCLKPADFITENVYDTRAKLRWTPVGASPTIGWWVIYGPQGFVPGPGVGDTVYVTIPKVTLTGLQKKTFYDAYLIQDCGNGDISAAVGPINFETYWTNDVGVSKVVTPISGCDLGLETLTIFMNNYGSAPQSLIPFTFTVNGEEVNVPQPNDGFYTGVLGKDSSELIEFETTYDFSAPGEYVIQVFTQMSGDEDFSNDTVTYYLIGRQVIPYTQDFELSSGGWTVDTSSINSSWEFGTPAKMLMNGAASGVNAWATSLTNNYNFNEQSYLNSPCFDFSDLTEDPVLEFSLFVRSELSYDGLFLELSLDGGTTWEKVGAVDEGQNWYNFFNTILDLGDVWAGLNNTGWITARHGLFGTAGESDVRLRFGFASDGSVQYEGFGIDDIHIYIPLADDLGASSITTSGADTQCGLTDDEVTFSFTNLGTQPQGFFQIAYSINGAAPVIENIGATVVSPDETFNYTFSTPFDSQDGEFSIQAWTILMDEQNPLNDTVSYFVSHVPAPLPFQEDFESGFVAIEDWAVSSGFANVTNAHNNVSQVLAVNLYSSFPIMDYNTPRFGFVDASDTLRFDYRITDYSGQGTVATVLGNNNIQVQISTDCGETYTTVYTIDNTTHTPQVTLQTVNIPMEAFADQAVILRFLGTWAAGDFWFDLDNINLSSCAYNMELSAITDPSSSGDNGAVTVTVGADDNPPYQFLWNTGATSETIIDLAVGTYTVTVTDADGCSDVLQVFVGESVATGDIEGLTALVLQPNPTTGTAQIQASFDKAVDVQVQVLNLLGQHIWEMNASRTTDLSETLDLTTMPDGLYLVRLTVDGQTATRKLIKSRP
jgi:Secretion system C-terminal sorting domain